ncbi:uncharacterized protein LOC116851862 [Odontomachus brunneus]|uniref:uncharacterized protein LOC116851862 n=1 Tax=Odontomachus brunneus TaxID=486640 RepID=UPI0013F1DB32|nr:uncharacterized protein LOC116851862 [Odontomachus brunneus]
MGDNLPVEEIFDVLDDEEMNDMDVQLINGNNDEQFPEVMEVDNNFERILDEESFDKEHIFAGDSDYHSDFLNINYIELLRFLQSAKNIVLGHVQNAMERHANLKNIKFPISVNQITKFEQQNNISINVYCFEKKTEKETRHVIFPIHLTSCKMDKHINLLHISDPRDHNTGHFAWIKNLSLLVSLQLSNYKVRKYICDRCLHYFHSNEKLESHTIDCKKLNDCTILLPSEDNKWLSFRNYSRKERVPFVVYADLECILQKMVSEKEEEGCTLHAYQHHKVFSIAYYLRCSYNNSLSYFRSRRDTDCISWFIEQLEELAHRVKVILCTNAPMETLSKEQ